MHIAHLHSNRDWGGGEDQVLQLLSGLANDSSVQVTLWADPKGALFRRAMALQLPTQALPASARIKRNPWGHLSLARQLKENGTTLIHAHDSFAGSIAMRVGQKTRLPVVLARRIASPLRQNAYSKNKYGADRVAGLIAISETVKQVLIESGIEESQIFVVGDGLDLPALDEVQADPILAEAESALIGGLGKLAKKKNWRFFIKVAAELKSRGETFHWVLAGSGPEASALREKAQMLGLGDDLTFLGFRNDAHRVLKSLDVLFFPSLLEGASVTIREAMALKVPVVTLDTPGSVESIGNNGWIVPAGDVGAAADALVSALRSTELREKNIAGAYADAHQRFAIEKTVADTVAVYRQILGG